MRRADRKEWASARTTEDLGLLVVRWLMGDLRQTPTHAGPPDPETRPHAGTLSAVNMAGYVTDNSQSASTAAEARAAGAAWNAWVAMLVRPGLMAPLTFIARRRGLVFETECRGARHSGHPRAWRACPRTDTDFFYRQACPLAAAEVCAAWYVLLADPETGRNDRLWPALEELAALGGAS